VTHLKRALASAAFLAATLPASAAAQQAPPLTAGWRDGFVIQNENGDFRLQIGLLVNADGRFVLDDPNDAVTNTFFIRRLRPTLRGRLGGRVEFYFNPDFAGGTVAVQDAYVDTRFSNAFRIRLGKAKTPFGLERLIADSTIVFYEHALPTAIVPNRDVGVQVIGDLRGGVISYMAGVLNGVADGASGDLDRNDSKDLAGRVILRPFNAKPEHSLRGLGIAIAGSIGDQSGAAALPTFRTTLAFQPFFSYSGATADGRRSRYSPQAFYYYKGFGGWAEYVHSAMPVREADIREEIVHEAWQIGGSFLLTGEAASDGVIRPLANFDFGNGHLGAIQVGARYHSLTVDGRAVALGFAAPGSSTTADAWTLGVTWFWNPYVKHVLNVEHTVFDDDPDGPRPAELAIVFRTQVSF
jgi:phosphate-selective porin OprO/OprP